MRETTTSPRNSSFLIAAVTTALGIALGATGGQAWACDKRGPNLREQWDLEIVNIEVEGEPRIEVLVSVGGLTTLHRLGKKRDDLILANPGMIFKRAPR
ncbi:MAG: hypothetical protein ACE37F_35555 [Nannocystaceae bacterium]|nr:hypothetical protein [bacterium]